MDELDCVLAFESPLRVAVKTRHGFLIGCISGAFTQNFSLMLCGGVLGGCCGFLWGCKQDTDDWLSKRRFTQGF